MIILAAIFTGIFTGSLHSVFAVIAVSALICIAFALAAIIGPVNLYDLGLAIIGFNCGLAALVGGHLLLKAARFDS